MNESEHGVITETALAAEFAARYRGLLCYVPRVGTRFKWFWFDAESQKWVVDDTLRVIATIKTLCREVATDCEDPADKRSICSAHFIWSVEWLARSELVAIPEAIGISNTTKQKRKKATEVDVM